jgi:hypothetical protein
LIPRCPHADLFSDIGRAWLKRQPAPPDEILTIERHILELIRHGEDLDLLRLLRLHSVTMPSNG